MLCAQRGYKCVITMAEPFSIERRKLMRFMGAKVIITPKAAKGSGMVAKAKELAEKHGWFLCRQFENEANAKCHYDTTGQEILNDFEGMKLDYYVLGYGTGGTFAGSGQALKEKRPGIKICLGEPADAPLVSSGTKSEHNDDGSATGSHPAFKPHPIQGWTPDFIPIITEKGIASTGYDEYVPIPGASMYAAVEMAKKAPEGSVLVAMLADTGERYLSTPLFASISADMNEEELEISKSTPSFQL
eukprot:s1700_g7.t1